jgi:hypothetical protein
VDVAANQVAQAAAVVAAAARAADKAVAVTKAADHKAARRVVAVTRAADPVAAIANRNIKRRALRSSLFSALVFFNKTTTRVESFHDLSDDVIQLEKLFHCEKFSGTLFASSRSRVTEVYRMADNKTVSWIFLY